MPQSELLKNLNREANRDAITDIVYQRLRIISDTNLDTQTRMNAIEQEKATFFGQLANNTLGGVLEKRQMPAVGNRTVEMQGVVLPDRSFVYNIETLEKAIERPDSGLNARQREYATNLRDYYAWAAIRASKRDGVRERVEQISSSQVSNDEKIKAVRNEVLDHGWVMKGTEKYVLAAAGVDLNAQEQAGSRPGSNFDQRGQKVNQQVNDLGSGASANRNEGNRRGGQGNVNEEQAETINFKDRDIRTIWNEYSAVAGDRLAIGDERKEAFIAARKRMKELRANRAADPAFDAEYRILEALMERERNVVDPPKVAGSGVMDPVTMARLSGSEGGTVSGQLGVAEALRKWSLEEGTTRGVEEWALKISEYLAGNPLYWAGGWQQATGYAYNELQAVKERASLSPKEYERLSLLTEAIITLRTQEAALVGSDETMSKYKELLPPVENMTSYVWTTTLRDALLEDPVIRSAFDWIKEDAFDASQDGAGVQKILKALSSKDRSARREFALDLAKDIIEDEVTYEQLTQCCEIEEWKLGHLSESDLAARIDMALSLFYVDEAYNWAAWIHKTAEKAPFGWYEGPGTLDRYENADDETLIKVRSATSSDFGKYKIAGHPFYSLVDPGGILRAKGGSYGEEIIRPYEEGVKRVVVNRFMKDEEIDVGNGKKEKRPRLMRLSEINGKNAGRVAEFMSIIMGDTYGSGFGDYTKIEKAVQNLQNLDMSAQWKYHEAGEVMAKMMVANLRAARAADPRTAAEIFISNIALVAENLTEQRAVLEQLLGKDKVGTSGVLRDLRAQYHLRMGTEELKREWKRFITGAKGNPEFLYKLSLVTQTIVGVSEGVASIGKGGKR